LDFGAHPMAARAQGFRETTGAIGLRDFVLEHAGVVEAKGNARIDMADAQPLRDLALDVRALHFPGAYESYLQPFLLESSFKTLTTSGRVAARVSIANGLPQQAKLELHEMSLDDGTQRLALRGLEGSVAWRAG